MRAVSVACGHEHTLVVTTCGALLGCGAGDCGRLGRGNRRDVLRLSSAGCHVGAASELAGERVVQASAGAAHSFAVCASGRAFSWGFGGSGALGHDTLENVLLPMPLEMLGGVRKAACGAFHTALLTRGGVVWTCGDGASGQLGDGQGVGVGLAAARAGGGGGGGGGGGSSQHGAGAGAPGHTGRGSAAEEEAEADACRSAAPLEAFPPSRTTFPPIAEADDTHGQLQARRVVDVACGASTTAAVTVGGQLFQWGCTASSVGAKPR
jgi:alpha-tubulin suppressor-like RCC1 family protein